MNERLRSIIEGVPYTLDKEKIIFLEGYINGTGHATLLGEAGSGKSLVMGLLKKYYGDEMVTFASTGVANQNLFDGRGGEGTAHSGMGMPIGMAATKDIQQVPPKCAAIFSKSDLVKHVVIDEAYMLNSDNLNVILKRIKRFNKKNGSRKAREIRVLLIGDCLQLPCIVSEMDRKYLHENHGHHLLFLSRPWQEMDPTVYMLQNVWRQGDRVFKAALNVLRFGEEERYAGVLKWLNKRWSHGTTRDAFTIASRNDVVDRVNRKTIAMASGDKRKYTAEVKGDVDFKELGVEEHISLAEGIDCITLINDQDGEYNNGSFCTIDELLFDGAWCTFAHTGQRVFVPLHEYKEYESYVATDVDQGDGTTKDELRRRETGQVLQIPLKAAAAFSGHRSQGRTFDRKGIVDIGDEFRETSDFGCSLLYVMLSRFTKVGHIHLARPLTKKHIKVCQDSIDFWMETKLKYEDLL